MSWCSNGFVLSAAIATGVTAVFAQTMDEAVQSLSCSFEKCYQDFGCRSEPLAITVDFGASKSRATIHTPGPRPFEATVNYDKQMKILSIVSDNLGGAVHMITVFKNGRAAMTSHTALEIDPKPVWISARLSGARDVFNSARMIPNHSAASIVR